MAEILHLGWCWNPINNGDKLPTSTGDRRISGTHQQYVHPIEDYKPQKPIYTHQFQDFHSWVPSLGRMTWGKSNRELR